MFQRAIFCTPRSLVDQNSDVYIFEVFAPHIRQQIQDQQMHVQWTDLMCALFIALSDRQVLTCFSHLEPNR